METTLRREIPINELRALGTQLQTLANEVHLNIKCTVKDGRLIVLGQHAADAVIHSTTVLGQLEHTIQALQLQFTQQVRLYLRVAGQRQPYAHHRFSLVPPPSRSRGTTAEIAGAVAGTVAGTVVGAVTEEQPWIVGDDELTSLVQQLTSSRSQPGGNLQHQKMDRAKPTDVDSALGNSPLGNNPLENNPLGNNPLGNNPLENSSLENHLLENSPSPSEGPAQPNSLDPCAVLEDGFIPNATQLLLPEIQNPESDHPNSNHPNSNHPKMATLVPFSPKGTTNPSNPGVEVAHHDGTHHDVNNHDQPLALPVAGMDTSRSFQDFTYETSQRLRELSNLFWSKGDADLPTPKVLATAHVEGGKSRRVAIATASFATIGVAVGLYGATRPCVMSYCQALNEATTLGEKSNRLMQQAQTWADIELTLAPLDQAIETLEPIPTWSSQRLVVQQQQQVYSHQRDQLNRLIAVEQTIQQADQIAHQTVYTPEDLQTVRSLWATAIEELETIPTHSPLYDFAQAQLTTYHPNLTQAQVQVEAEKAATAMLETAQEAAQLAQARQGIAQTLENWQFARVTWIVALDRLSQVPANTLAATEAQRLQPFYQSALNEVNQRVEQEQAIATALSQATQQAELAVAAEKRHEWTKAIADWTTALNYVQSIESEGGTAVKVEELQTHYQNSLAEAQAQLAAHAQIEGELKQSCIGELQLCHILSIGQPIKLQLDESYLDAINTARDNANYNLKAVVTDHQLMVRQSLDRIANNFGVQIEVYNPSGGLLERHMPNGR